MSRKVSLRRKKARQLQFTVESSRQLQFTTERFESYSLLRKVSTVTVYDGTRLDSYSLRRNTSRWYQVGCLRFTKFCWVGKHVILSWNRRTPQPKANPTQEKNRLKVAFGPLFPQQIFFRGLGMVLCRKQTTRNPSLPSLRKHPSYSLPWNTSRQLYSLRWIRLASYGLQRICVVRWVTTQEGSTVTLYDGIVSTYGNNLRRDLDCNSYKHTSIIFLNGLGWHLPDLSEVPTWAPPLLFSTLFLLFLFFIFFFSFFSCFFVHFLLSPSNLVRSNPFFIFWRSNPLFIFWTFFIYLFIFAQNLFLGSWTCKLASCEDRWRKSSTRAFLWCT